jgi:putative transposase|tara:strand:+ start:87 stop:920 length:834 start_codon:yes stop_codon:yes gene_type:complete
MRKAEQNLNLSHLCQLFDVPVSSYYYQSVHKPNDAAYRDKLTVIHNENFQAYGRRRMKVALADNGINLGVFKIARLMKQAGIIAQVPKKPHYYPSGKQKPNIPNELKRQFNPPQVNTHWVGDITYIRHHQGWSYLATVLDLGSREIVGYALSQTPDAQLARQALIQAVKIQQPKTSHLMFHSDQGVQYSANLFKQTLSLHRIKQSMSRRGNCWDNAVQERFFRSLKSEYLNGLSFVNHQAVVLAVEHYIRYYNNKRINSTIGYMTPVLKRQALLKVA